MIRPSSVRPIAKWCIWSKGVGTDRQVAVGAQWSPLNPMDMWHGPIDRTLSQEHPVAARESLVASFLPSEGVTTLNRSFSWPWSGC
jgi:hypothetical protein